MCGDCNFLEPMTWERPLLSDFGYDNLGVPSRGEKDAGLGGQTGNPEELGQFKAPSLRNIALTAPYMHNGSMKTLEDVVTFYFRGIPQASPDGLVPDTSALTGQSFSDIDAMVAFLKSLSGKAPEITPPDLP